MSARDNVTPSGNSYNRTMQVQVEAVYENGMLRPLQPLNLMEHEQVTVIVSAGSAVDDGPEPNGWVARLRKEAEAYGPPPGLEEVRRVLSKIPGSMTQDFIDEREDR